MQPREWLNQLYAAVANVPSDPKPVAARIEATIFACALLPAAVWCEDALRQAVQEIKLFPAASEVYSVLVNWCATYLPRQQPIAIPDETCRLLGQGRAPEPITDEQAARNRATVEQACSALYASANAREGNALAPCRPLPLSPAELLAEYEALAAKNERCGTPSSAVNRRIRTLRDA